MAQSRHHDRVGECPLSGVKQTSKFKSVTSAFDPKRQSGTERNYCRVRGSSARRPLQVRRLLVANGGANREFSIRSAVNRRRLLTTSASTATLAAVSSIARPYLSFAADRPTITHGVQSGDVSVELGRGLGARRPAVPHAGRDFHHRQFQRDSSGCLC